MSIFAKVNQMKCLTSLSATNLPICISVIVFLIGLRLKPTRALITLRRSAANNQPMRLRCFSAAKTQKERRKIIINSINLTSGRSKETRCGNNLLLEKQAGG